jgi:hypothetical protein
MVFLELGMANKLGQWWKLLRKIYEISGDAKYYLQFVNIIAKIYDICEMFLG